MQEATHHQASVTSNELLSAISKDRQAHPSEVSRTLSHNSGATAVAEATPFANKVFGLVMAVFITLAATVLLIQA